jgi:hypothetical protein
MTGIDSEKRARGFERQGKYKEAGDYWSLAFKTLGNSEDLAGLYRCYEKTLEDTNDRTVINDIRFRLKKLGLSSDFKYLLDESKKRSLERHVGSSHVRRVVLATVSIISLIGALASISMNMTGNAIGGSLDNNGWISIGLFFLGCAFTLFYFKAKNKNTENKKK